MAQQRVISSTDALRESSGQTFRSLGVKLDETLLKGLDKMGYEYMTPVQHKVLTELPSMSSDCLVQAKTGTGKTIAFLLPAIQNILQGNPCPVGQVAILILCPTRELVLQIAKECDQVTSCIPASFECHTAFGGTGRASNLNKFMKGNPTAVVATPGRLNDYLSEERVRQKFENVKTLVLDEADRMLDQGFLPAIKQVLRQLPPKNSGWQGMCFSATIPESINDVTKHVMFPGYVQLSTIDGSEVPTIDRVPQYSVVLPDISLIFCALYELIKHEWMQTPTDFKAIIFGTTANGTALLASLFQNLIPDLEVYQLQSRLSQNLRTRTTSRFKEASSGLMFASDVIGRGMDFPNVGLVIQLGLPASAEQYIHRVGRTARAGKDGRAIIVLFENESYFIKINKQLPIQKYPLDITDGVNTSVGTLSDAFARVDEGTKSKAYQAFLGFNKSFMKKLRVDASSLVQLANKYAQAMGCTDPPIVDKKVVGKMGLKGVPGIRVSPQQVYHNEGPSFTPVAYSDALQNVGRHAKSRGSGSKRRGRIMKR